MELSLNSVRIETDGGINEILVPSDALPVNVEASSVRFSRKRGLLTITWPCLDISTTQAPPAKLEAETEEQKEAAEHRQEHKAEEEVAPKCSEEDPEKVPEREVMEQETRKHEPSVGSKTADEWKALGNEAVKMGQHAEALESYSAGLTVEPNHAILLSNRALCLHKLGRLEEALIDAKRCTALQPDLFKGFCRGAMILRELGRPCEALELLRKAPLHHEIEKISAEVRPEAEAAEEARIASLSGAERRKEEANAIFKKGLVDQALSLYNEALGMCSDPECELALTIRNNRANCYNQLSNFEAVVEDTNFILERQPDNLKALIRRMIAFEPLEKYEKALEDARRVLRHVPGHDVANRLQHRLGKLVRDSQREKNGGA